MAWSSLSWACLSDLLGLGDRDLLDVDIGGGAGRGQLGQVGLGLRQAGLGLIDAGLLLGDVSSCSGS